MTSLLASERFALHRPEFRGSIARGDEKIAALMEGTERSLPAGHVLIGSNTGNEFVYRLMSGWASYSRVLADGRIQSFLVSLPHDLLGVTSMFCTRPADDVVILSPAVVQCLAYHDLHGAFVSDADVSNRCIWQMLEEDRRLHSWVVALGLGSAEERLALLLIDVHGRLTLSGTIAPHAACYSMPLTQTKLAEHVGVTSVHINRVLKSFRDSGVVTVRDGLVRIDDLPKLRQIAYPLLDAYERWTPEYVGPVTALEPGALSPSDNEDPATVDSCFGSIAASVNSRGRRPFGSR